MSEYRISLDFPVRIVLTITSIFITIVGVLGNLLVWYGSVFRQAIRMETAARILITNLAMVDVLMTMMLFGPLIVTLSVGEWVFGAGFCVVQGVSLDISLALEIFIMLSLNCYRLWAVKKTKKQRDVILPWHVYLYLFIVVLLCGGYMLVHLAVGEGLITAGFDEKVGACRAFLGKDNIHNVVTLGYIVPPLVISFVASKILKCILCYTSKRAGTKNSKSQRALSLVCWAMIISYMPCYVILVWEMVSEDLPHWVFVFRTFSKSLNLIVNPLIYYFYSATFKDLVNQMISCPQISDSSEDLHEVGVHQPIEMSMSTSRVT